MYIYMYLIMVYLSLSLSLTVRAIAAARGARGCPPRGLGDGAHTLSAPAAASAVGPGGEGRG